LGHTIQDDGKTWKLTLRDGLIFHDGQKVLARDCVASIKRWGARDAFGQALIQRADEISAPDDKTIVLHLKQPFAAPRRAGPRRPQHVRHHASTNR
jgi:peptide/nickel transport system substrate-binding protein